VINNSGMYFNYNSNFNGYGGMPGGCCMNGAFNPYYQPNQYNYMRGNDLYEVANNQQYAACPYMRQSMQYSPAVQCYNAAGIPILTEDNQYVGYINPSQLNMRMVSIEEVAE
jgi:hypothetical protein